MRSGAAKDRFPLELPTILGRDISGIVREVGNGVNGFKPGDKVMALGNKAYAELAVVAVKDLALVPEKLDLVKAAALPLVTQTGEQLITHEDSVWTDSAGFGAVGSGTVGGVDGEEGGSGGDRRGEKVATKRGDGAGSGPGFGYG
jgi:NADPH:quinone reductase-like Zn-dependent oxidoreductase